LDVSSSDADGVGQWMTKVLEVLIEEEGRASTGAIPNRGGGETGGAGGDDGDDCSAFGTASHVREGQEDESGEHLTFPSEGMSTPVTDTSHTAFHETADGAGEKGEGKRAGCTIGEQSARKGREVHAGCAQSRHAAETGADERGARLVALGVSARALVNSEP
jgi:hypothetical protein